MCLANWVYILERRVRKGWEQGRKGEKGKRGEKGRERGKRWAEGRKKDARGREEIPSGKGLG